MWEICLGGIYRKYFCQTLYKEKKTARIDFTCNFCLIFLPFFSIFHFLYFISLACHSPTFTPYFLPHVFFFFFYFLQFLVSFFKIQILIYFRYFLSNFSINALFYSDFIVLIFLMTKWKQTRTPCLFIGIGRF